jgi:uncharacterized Rossmann fold enzyme
MEFTDWEPVYETLLADFGYPRDGDERAGAVLADVATETGYTLAVGDVPAKGTVAIAGAGPSLESEAETAVDADTVYAASTAGERLREVGVAVDVLTTDLDKSPETPVAFSQEGVTTVVHAHGDNVSAVREVAPRCDPAHTLGTTQAASTGPVVNVGGFTDGDRAAFLADHRGADRLVFPGWDFDDTDVDEEKKHKLVWAERLLYWLEVRRGERFSVLDDRRGDIDTSVLPIG